jgi:hydroxymethylbilane synthase
MDLLPFDPHAIRASNPLPIAPRGYKVARHGHGHALPLKIGTRASPLALVQTRHFLELVSSFCPVLKKAETFQEHQISTAGDRIQDRRLAEVGGKGLFSKEIHEALIEGRVDFGVHSLKDLETTLPPGIVLACTLRREDPRDAIILGPGCETPQGSDLFGVIPRGALVGTSSVRRQSQLLHARPDLSACLIRGNVATRLAKVREGQMAASLLAIAGMKRLGLEHEADVVLDEDAMVPAACQGIVGVTVRESDAELCDLLLGIEDPLSRAVATAERALLGTLDGSCRTPIGGHARLAGPGRIRLTGLVARADGSFLLRRAWEGSIGDAERLGRELGESLKADAPCDVFA